MGNMEPNDPSLALCQLCKNRGDMTAYAKDMDGILRQYPTCMRYTFHNCNDFVPDHTAASKQVAQLIANYGRRSNVDGLRRYRAFAGLDT